MTCSSLRTESKTAAKYPEQAERFKIVAFLGIGRESESTTRIEARGINEPDLPIYMPR